MTKNPALKSTLSTDAAGVVLMSLFGPLDENAFESLPDLPDSCRSLDLSGITRANSSGADAWIRWLKVHDYGAREIVVKRMAPVFVRVLNSIEEMVPDLWLIESFYVPHANQSTGLTENVLFIRDRHFTKSDVFVSPFSSSSIDDQKIYVDVDPERYFRFLKSRSPDIRIHNL